MSRILKYDEYDNISEMANITSDVSGIDNIIIWIGPNPPQHGKRIKISNIPNKIRTNDVFTLTIPDFEIKGNRNEKIVNNKKLKQIKKFVNININLIEEYMERKISTIEFSNRIKSIKEENDNSILEFNEYQDYDTTLTNYDLMTSLSDKGTGLKNIIIWIGPTTDGEKIIRVGNEPNKINLENSFKINIEDYEIIGDINKDFITDDKLKNIKKFIELNYETIELYSNFELSTFEMIKRLQKIK